MTAQATRCPSELALERHLLRADAAIDAHLEGCGGCAARLATMRADGDDFRRDVFPATVDRVEEAARPRRLPRWLKVLLPVPAVAAAAAAVLLVIRPGGPADDYVGTKGAGGLGLSAFAKASAGDGARLLADGAEVRADAVIRLRVRTPGPCRLALLSVDAAGQVSSLSPGTEGPLQQGQHDLPGGIALDGAAGPERLFAVCLPDGAAAAAVDRAARAVAAGGPDRVRRATGLDGLPPGTPQATLLLEKRP